MQFNVKQVREYLEGLPCPICTKNVSDETIEKMIQDVDNATKRILNINYIDLEDEEIDDVWFVELEEYAILNYEMEYYEDMKKDKIN